MDALSAMPETFAAGTMVRYEKTHADYPGSDGWAIALHLRGPSVADVSGTYAGGVWTFELDASESANLLKGTYRWVERASKATEAYVVASGLVTVTPNMVTAVAGDLQTFAEKQLAQVEAAIADIVAGKLQSYTIAGRGGEKLGLEELLKLRDQLAAEIRRTRSGGQLGRQHVMEFRRPS